MHLLAGVSKHLREAEREDDPLENVAAVSTVSSRNAIGAGASYWRTGEHLQEVALWRSRLPSAGFSLMAMAMVREL